MYNVSDQDLDLNINGLNSISSSTPIQKSGGGLRGKREAYSRVNVLFPFPKKFTKAVGWRGIEVGG